MIRIVLTGAQGQVGWDLQRTLSPLGEIFALNRQALDLSQPETIQKTLQEIKPHIVVNAAAYTAVDKAETEKELCMTVNAVSPGVMAKETKKLGAIFVHYSTDYVFNGASTTPYSEEDFPEPLNNYGYAKLMGEQAIQSLAGAHLIFRTSWVYSTRGKNFLLTMLKLAKEKESLRVVNDQVGAPTWSRMVAQATAQILYSYLMEQKKSPWGIYNLVCSGQVSWCGFAEKILSLYSQQQSRFRAPKLVGIPSLEYPTPAKRPSYSVLSLQKTEKIFSIRMPSWDKSLELCLLEMSL